MNEYSFLKHENIFLLSRTVLAIRKIYTESRLNSYGK